MTCEGKDLRLLNKDVLEADMRFHAWRLLATATDLNIDDRTVEANLRFDIKQLRVVRDVYVERFGNDTLRKFRQTLEGTKHNE